MKKFGFFLVFLAIFLSFFLFLKQKPHENVQNEQKNAEKTQKILKIGQKMLNIEVADTEFEKIAGLSGKKELLENQGMLFVFENDGYYGFWMKDMLFSIDMAWLDADKKIIYIKSNVAPETYPEVFYAYENGRQVLSRYVLETSAGFFENNKIKIGDTAEF